jgi:4-phytase/acid phosphatase
VEGALGAPGQKLVILVGHDTNLAGIASLLDLHWTLDGRSDDTPPGTELAFELWQTASGAYLVRSTVTAQTLEQMHELQPAHPTAPPSSSILPSACPAQAGACPWLAFRSIAEKATSSPATR